MLTRLDNTFTRSLLQASNAKYGHPSAPLWERCAVITFALLVVSIVTELREWIFVCAGAVDRGHRDIQDSQIDRQLPAMVVVMVHED
jgi:hypothetical protein